MNDSAKQSFLQEIPASPVLFIVSQLSQITETLTSLEANVPFFE